MASISFRQSLVDAMEFTKVEMRAISQQINIPLGSEKDECTSKAWSLNSDYEVVADNPARRVGIVYAFEGMIEKFIHHGRPMTILFAASTKDKPMKVVLEYYGEKPWPLEDKTRVYADCIGGRDGLPLLAARYNFAE